MSVVAQVAANPLYRIAAHHVPALYAAALAPAVVWLVRWRPGRGGRRAMPLATGYRQLPVHHRILVWLLLLTAAAHVGLVASEERPILRLLFLLDAAALGVVTRRLVFGRPWRLWGALILVGSLLGYAVAGLAYEPPDQVGMATKLVELLALAIALRPKHATRWRELAASFATVALVVVTGIGGWAGAFAASSRAAPGGGHHGAAPAPGEIVAVSTEREPTHAERAAADRFYRTAAFALRKYHDPTVAAADGYQVHGIVGSDFHAANPRFASDGRIFDPVRPENLIYAQTSAGPVLLGAMYELPKVGRAGPRIGGPLTEWHAHGNVCFSLIPPALSGLESPFGDCPVGSIDVPITAEMIHLWLIPGVRTRFGDLGDQQRTAYLASLAATRSGG